MTLAYFGDERLPPRFWVKVRILDNGCWERRAGLTQKGYGQFRWRGQRRLAHRMAYQLLVGSFPPGLESDHLCRNPSCVNPAHIELVTHRENILRGNAITARNALKTHCLHGHAFNDENTYFHPKRNSERACRVCKRANLREYRKRKREATLA